tara:strand:+ start:9955 stop:10896 length:942 start_codon:yes stop_codon:yes gene_type:complete
MSIALSNNNPRLHFTATAGQTAFTVSFEFFDNDDLDVYVNDVQKTITSDYTVSGGDGSTGTVTFTSGLTLNDAVAITRRIDIERTANFFAGQTINRAALNTQLDTLTAIAADNKDRSDRAVKVSDSENASSSAVTIPSKATRKGRVLGFNETTGAMENGPLIADVQSLANVTADIATLADIEDGTNATNAIQSVAAIASNVSTVAGVASNVTTVAGISSNVTAVANDATDIGAVAAKATEIGRLGTASAVADLAILGTADAVSDMNDLAPIAANITTVANNTTNINTVATNISTISQKATVEEATALAIALGG